MGSNGHMGADAGQGVVLRATVVGWDGVSSNILRRSYYVRVPVSSLLVDPPPKAKDRVPFADVA